MGWNSYLDSIVTRVAAVTGINRCERAAHVDIDKMVAVPRWPQAIVSDFGGEIDPFSGDIYIKRFAVTLAVLVPRGTNGKEASKKLAEISEAVVAELTHTRDHGEITLFGEMGEVAESSGTAEVYMQTFLFNYLVLE